MQSIGNKEWGILVCGVNLDTNENEHTILAIYLNRLQTVQVLLSIYIDTEEITFFLPYAVNNQGARMGVVYHQSVCSTTLLREYRV